jgi:hypothetical protein
LLYKLTHFYKALRNLPINTRPNLMLHLHRFNDGDDLVLNNLIASSNQPLN